MNINNLEIDYDLHIIQNSNNVPGKQWCIKLASKSTGIIKWYAFGNTPDCALEKLIKKANIK